MSSQEAALSIWPTVIEAGGEVCEDGHFGFCGITFTTSRAGRIGTPVLQGSLVPREQSAPEGQAMLMHASSPLFWDLLQPS